MKETTYERRERQIYNCLKELGISPNMRGYHYITHIVQDALKRNPIYNNMPLMCIYDKTAVQFYTTQNSVERCIRHAIERCFDNLSPEIAQKYFGNCISYERGKLTNKQFITLLVEHIKIMDRRPKQ